MRLQLISDLHDNFPEIQPYAEYVALLGDVTSPDNPKYEKYIEYLSSMFRGVFVVLGNHEYYEGIMKDVENKMNDICNKFPNVYLLINKSIMIDGILFVGSTLWSDINEKAFDYLNCGKLIKMRRNKKMDVNDYLVLHYKAVEFIKQEVNKGIPTVVLTHYAPIDEMNGQKINSPYKSGFSSDLSYINNSNIIAWLSGHTHNCMTLRKNNILYSSNCLGHELNPRFSTHQVIKIR